MAQFKGTSLAWNGKRPSLSASFCSSVRIIYCVSVVYGVFLSVGVMYDVFLSVGVVWCLFVYRRCV